MRSTYAKGQSCRCATQFKGSFFGPGDHLIYHYIDGMSVKYRLRFSPDLRTSSQHEDGNPDNASRHSTDLRRCRKNTVRRVVQSSRLYHPLNVVSFYTHGASG